MNVRTIREISALIRQERRLKKWSQAELASRAGVSREWILDLEKGKSTVEVSLVLRTLYAVELTLSIEPVVKPETGQIRNEGESPPSRKSSRPKSGNAEDKQPRPAEPGIRRSAK